MATGPADKILDVFKDLVFDTALKLVINKIIAQAAFLSWGPIAYLVGVAVNYIGGLLYEALREYINLEVIILKHEAHHKAFVSAQIALRGIAQTKGIESQEFQDARSIHKAALAKFLRSPA